MGRFSGAGYEVDVAKRPRPRRSLLLGRPQPVVFRSVKGVGREGSRRYCGRCGHTKARCICRD